MSDDLNSFGREVNLFREGVVVLVLFARHVYRSERNVDVV